MHIFKKEIESFFELMPKISYSKLQILLDAHFPISRIHRFQFSVPWKFGIAAFGIAAISINISTFNFKNQWI
jgi:hypothetical protein